MLAAQRCRSTIRRWKPGAAGGLAVADLPAEVAVTLGGLKQQRVVGTINGAEFASNVMPAGGGILALSVSKAMMTSAGASVGDDVQLTIGRAPTRERVSSGSALGRRPARRSAGAAQRPHRRT
jgi:Domain of unknown function (DUF1905)